MYSHAMACCALSEAYGMTMTQRLERPVRRAIAFTVAAQDQRAADALSARRSGDTSQLGWQLMALKSADLAGIPIPPLDSRRHNSLPAQRIVGQAGRPGLNIRPGEGPSAR